MFSSPAYAQAAGASAAGSGAALIMQFLPIVAILGIFYLLVWRPQSQKMKAQRATIDAVKKGDTVVTAGGVIGKVTRNDGGDGEIEVEIAPNMRVRLVKSTLSEVRPLGGGKPAND